MNNRSTLLLEHPLKELKLPSFLREYGNMAAQCAAEGVDHPTYLLRLAELDSSTATSAWWSGGSGRPGSLPSKAWTHLRLYRHPLGKQVPGDGTGTLRIHPAPGEYHRRRQQRHRQDPHGLGSGLAACQRGMSVGFTTAAALVHELMEAWDERRLLNLQRQLSRLSLLIIDELGFVPLSPTGAELLFEVFSQRYERGSILVTTNLPFDEWTEVFGSERLTGALLPHPSSGHFPQQVALIFMLAS